MATTKQVFVLVGPLAGQTISVNGHEFVDGRLAYTGDDTSITILARIFGMYGAFKEGEEPRTPDGQLLTDPLGKSETGPNDDEAKALEAQRLEDEKAATAQRLLDDQAAEVKRLEEEKLAEAARLQDEADQKALDDAAAKKLEDEVALAAALGGDGDGSKGGSADDTTKPTLAEAIGQLDPEDEKAWTSNNLPAIDLLSDLTGTKVTRSDVEAAAAGYTRAKARAARG